MHVVVDWKGGGGGVRGVTNLVFLVKLVVLALQECFIERGISIAKSRRCYMHEYQTSTLDIIIYLKDYKKIYI